MASSHIKCCSKYQAIKFDFASSIGEEMKFEVGSECPSCAPSSFDGESPSRVGNYYKRYGRLLRRSEVALQIIITVI